MIHIGKLIRQQVAARGISHSEFARRIHTTRQNVTAIYKRKSIDTDLLLSISKVLEIDFFREYSGELENPNKKGVLEFVQKEFSFNLDGKSVNLKVTASVNSK